jgi:transposase InsO family protein
VEADLRSRAVEFAKDAGQRGWTMGESAKVLGMSRRTLDGWLHDAEVGRETLRLRGRPLLTCNQPIEQEMASWLHVHGPSICLSALQEEFPRVRPAPLVRFFREYRAEYERQHDEGWKRLLWLHPGRVWAMDHSFPPAPIDGRKRAIFTVRDLASHHHLLWTPVSSEAAEAAVRQLRVLFITCGAPLLLKCDNGSAFLSERMKRFLEAWGVTPLYSPPRSPRYNGAIERANLTLKRATAHEAELAGHPGWWRTDDLDGALSKTNAHCRPWGVGGGLPVEQWEKRPCITAEERKDFLEALARARADVREQCGEPQDAELGHYAQAAIDRMAGQIVLEALGYLVVTRR